MSLRSNVACRVNVSTQTDHMTSHPGGLAEGQEEHKWVWAWTCVVQLDVSWAQRLKRRKVWGRSSHSHPSSCLSSLPFLILFSSPALAPFHQNQSWVVFSLLESFGSDPLWVSSSCQLCFGTWWLVSCWCKLGINWLKLTEYVGPVRNQLLQMAESAQAVL